MTFAHNLFKMDKGGCKAMIRLLDARTSQNASFASSSSIALESIPILIGVVGLQIINPVGVIRVQFHGTATFSLGNAVVNQGVLFRVVRGTTLSDPLVYSAQENFPETPSGQRRIITFTGSDFNVPPPPSGELVYTLFISSTDIAPAFPIRVGPESFNAEAYSDG
jgi:hypothetical protein